MMCLLVDIFGLYKSKYALFIKTWTFLLDAMASCVEHKAEEHIIEIEVELNNHWRINQGNSVNSLLGISGDCQMPDSFLEKRLWKSA